VKEEEKRDTHTCARACMYICMYMYVYIIIYIYVYEMCGGRKRGKEKGRERERILYERARMYVYTCMYIQFPERFLNYYLTQNIF